MRIHLFAQICLAAFIAPPVLGQFDSVPTVGFEQWNAPDTAGLITQSADRHIGIELGVMGLMRETPRDQLLAVDGSFNPILNANEFQGSMQFGLRTMLDIYEVRPFWDGTDLQFGYFGINSLDAETTIAADSVIPIFFNGVPASPQPSSNFIYSTNIYSAEFNFRFRSRRAVRPLMGLRFFKTEDSYDAFQHGTAPVIREGFFSSTNNSLFGGQFGAEADVFRGKYYKFFAIGKLGVMNNEIEGVARVVDATAGTEVQRFFGENQFTTMLDLSAGIELSLMGPLSVRIAYQLLHVDEVATGIDQNESVQVLGPSDTLTFNSQQFHGINVTSFWEF